MTRPDRLGKKAVQAFVTVEKWKKLRHIVTETQRTANDLITEAIDLLAEKYEQPKRAYSRPAPPLSLRSRNRTEQGLQRRDRCTGLCTESGFERCGRLRSAGSASNGGFLLEPMAHTLKSSYGLAEIELSVPLLPDPQIGR